MKSHVFLSLLSNKNEYPKLKLIDWLGPGLCLTKIVEFAYNVIYCGNFIQHKI